MSMQGYYFLNPSGIRVSRRPALIHTVLGSCVAICLWDEVNRLGGMNHYMLPYWNGKGLASPKFGNIAVHKLIEEVISVGGRRSHLQAKVFGGAEVLEMKKDFFQIGQRNIQVGLETLEEAGIPVTGKSLGGKNGRKIIFDTQTGVVTQRMIVKSKVLNHSG